MYCFEVDFYIISVALLIEMSNSCVSVGGTENIFLLSFVPYYAESCIFIIQVLFPYILVSFKKGTHGECNGIFGINVIFFLLTLTSGWFLLVQHYGNWI